MQGCWSENNSELAEKFVEDIDKAHLTKFFDYLVDDEPENCPFTAAWKILRVNKFIRTVLKLDPGNPDLRRNVETSEAGLKEAGLK